MTFHFVLHNSTVQPFLLDFNISLSLPPLRCETSLHCDPGENAQAVGASDIFATGRVETERQHVESVGLDEHLDTQNIDIGCDIEWKWI